MLSSNIWISAYSSSVSLSDVSDNLTSCKNSDPVTPLESVPLFDVISTNPFTASANAAPFFSLSSCTRLDSLFLWLTSPPSAWPTAERRCRTLSAKRCAEAWWCDELSIWGSISSSMLLIESESSSSDGGWSKEEGLGGGSQTPSSIQDTLWGDWGTGLLWRCNSGVPFLGVEEVDEDRLPVLTLWGWAITKSRLGRRRTTPAGVCSVGAESAEQALIKPE